MEDPGAGPWRPVGHFSVGPAPPAATEAPLLFDGRAVGRLAARAIEAQFAAGNDHWLLLATWDSPFEEELTILLLDAGFRPRDRVRLGGAWQPGILSGVEIRDGTLRFRFPRGETYRLSLAPGRAWPFFGRGGRRLVVERER